MAYIPLFAGPISLACVKFKISIPQACVTTLAQTAWQKVSVAVFVFSLSQMFAVTEIQVLLAVVNQSDVDVHVI